MNIEPRNLNALDVSMRRNQSRNEATAWLLEPLRALLLQSNTVVRPRFSMKQHSWLAFAFGSALFAGLTAILGKIGVAGVSSNFATFIRTGVVLIFAAALVGLRGEWSTSVSGRTWTFLVLSGLATGASWLCYYRALQLAPASLVAPIDKLSVVIAIVLGVLLLGEPLSWKLVTGGALILSGALLIATISG
jgi:transporter family protein